MELLLRVLGAVLGGGGHGPGTGRRGPGLRRRVAERRAVNDGVYGDGGSEAKDLAELAVALCGAVTGACGLLLARQGEAGHPPPTWTVVLAAPLCASLVFVGVGGLLRWWCGERFLRGVLLPRPLVKLECAAAGALFGGAVLLATGPAAERQWGALSLGGHAWLLVASIRALSVVSRRAAGRAAREKREEKREEKRDKTGDVEGAEG
ncbi:hypothetical protein G3I62_34370 [Streptomyces sp. SID14446]|uniref:hypothetical protein n=1 Tax=Streptomyces sp. SID14446 TaxID=2706072 RepID=UPI0013B7F905|nr:hypothetical protein [Streptomyces sp. SID14446]NEB34107.1 hypothetical protein [Streptomyces sp. SID14446]